MKTIIAAICAVLLVILGIVRFGNSGHPAAPPSPSTNPVKSQVAATPTLAEKAEEMMEDAGSSVREPAPSSAIEAFRQWAETGAASGFSGADETKGMQLAKARATAMKALIQTDPVSALRQALPAKLRAALPPSIAAAIEQPVKTSGTVSLRMMCKHSTDTDHGGCESAPVLLQDTVSWNAYYDEQKWHSHLGKTVDLDGIAVDEELAVRSVTPVPAP